MTEAFKIAITIFGGVIVFVLGQIFLKFFIEPIYERRKTIGLISDAILNYLWIFICSGKNQNSDHIQKASKELRWLASQLKSRTVAIPCYSFFARIGFLRPFSEIESACKDLYCLAYYVNHPDFQVDWQAKMKLASKVAYSLSIANIDSDTFKYFKDLTNIDNEQSKSNSN